MKRLLTTTAAAALTAAAAVGAATAPLPPLNAAAAAGESSAGTHGRRKDTAAGVGFAASGSSARPSGTAGKNKNHKVPPRASDGGPDRYIPKSVFPSSSSGLWTDVSDPADSDRVEFLPASSLLAHHDGAGTTETHLPPNLHRQLTRSGLQNPYNAQTFVNGEVDWDEYQQAWRYLGFYIDCDSSADDDASWDGGTGEGCTRFLIWAAVSSFCCSSRWGDRTSPSSEIRLSTIV